MKQIKRYPSYYTTRTGEIWSNKSGKLKPIKSSFNKDKYLKVKLYKKGKAKNFLVARLVAETYLHDFDPNLSVDHINGKKTDNRVENLRMVTHKENLRGFLGISKNASSKYRGVSWDKLRKKWRSRIGIEYFLGYFNDEIEAAKAYDRKAIELGYQKEALNF